MLPRCYEPRIWTTRKPSIKGPRRKKLRRRSKPPIRLTHERGAAYVTRLAAAEPEIVEPLARSTHDRLGEDPDAPLPSELSIERRMHVFDTALDLADFRFSKQLLDASSAESAFKQRLLSRRAKLGVQSPALRIPQRELDNPLRGHDVGRWDLGHGYSSLRGFYHALDVRLALHDWSDPSPGYPETLSISFLPLRLRYYLERQQLELEELSLISITSLVPIDVFDRSISWHARAGGARIHDAGCDECFAGIVEAGGGVAASAFAQGVLLFANLNTAVMGLGPIEGGIAELPLRVGVGPKAGLRLRLDPELIGVLRAD